MLFDPQHHNRRSLRLRGYDYADIGMYFITARAAKRGRVFGTIRQGEMKVNAHGRALLDEWAKTELLRPEVTFDSWCLMPDHFHALIHIEGEGKGETPHFGYRVPRSLGAIRSGWKGTVTRAINRLRDERGWAFVPVWQRDYFDRIVRDERELELIRRYIYKNPLNWETDNHFEA